MTPEGAGVAAQRAGAGAGRVAAAWRRLPGERRLAAYAALGEFVALFLPWYQRQYFAIVSGHVQPASSTQNAWQAFSFVEAAVLVVAVFVLAVLFQRAEGRAFHLPGGDGGVITAAGGWSCFLIIWRIFDRQGGAVQGQIVTSDGIEWGIFVALAFAALLVYAGTRIRASRSPERPLPGEGPVAPAPGPRIVTTRQVQGEGTTQVMRVDLPPDRPQDED